jgi:hypothetical protein
MATLVRNHTPGLVTIPAQYGGGQMAPGGAIIVNDTVANAEALFGPTITAGLLEYATVTSGQPGQIAPNSALAPQAIQKGTATLSGGTVTVTGVTLTANSVIMHSRNTTGGTPGNLSAPAASRNTSTGQFVIQSSSGTETSTVDWVIIG